VTMLLESNTAAEIPPASLLPESVEIHVATEDGSLGHHGSAADLVATYAAWADQVVAAGSSELLSATTLLLRAAGVSDRTSARVSRPRGEAGAKRLQLIVAHEIGCGSGVCGGCTYQSAAGSVRLCKEGPAVTPSGSTGRTRGAR
jgi:dihydroorotate dehydrogenase electron transfer subunit